MGHLSPIRKLTALRILDLPALFAPTSTVKSAGEKSTVFADRQFSMIMRDILIVYCRAHWKIAHSLRQPRNRPAGHVVTAANRGQRLLAMIAALDRFALLVIGELRFAPHLHAVRLGAFAAFAGAGAD